MRKGNFWVTESVNNSLTYTMHFYKGKLFVTWSYGPVKKDQSLKCVKNS